MKLRTPLMLTCGACPVQMEGFTEEGYYVYARSRYSRFSITVWESADDFMHGEALYDLQATTSNRPYHEITSDQLRHFVTKFLEVIES